ncbi:MAG: hypothetical protein HQ481_02280 [Alphaproteobacteria bacterium]|nr:hypothetical protein [Alphaproteobacteria bacterium]
MSPALPLARKTGHLSEFVAIAARRRRRRADWAAHEGRTRGFVERVAATVEADGIAVILGAGHVDDIPLDALAARFEAVVLVDLAFSLATCRAAQRLGNVECWRRDVTESLDSLPEVREPEAFLDDPRVRFVASVNLLSQLGVIPTRTMADEDADTLSRRLIEAHLRWLSRFGCPVVLITDAAVEVVDRSDAVTATLDPMKGVTLPPAAETWTWDIAPRGELDRDHAIRHQVVAIEGLPCAKRN